MSKAFHMVKRDLFDQSLVDNNDYLFVILYDYKYGVVYIQVNQDLKS